MKVLLIGATGTIGSIIAKLLYNTSIDLRLTSSRQDSIAAIKDEYRDAEVVVADLLSVSSLSAAVEGVDRIMLISPDLIGEKLVCSNIKQAIEMAGGVERIVKLLTFPPGLSIDDIDVKDRKFELGYNQGLTAKAELDKTDLPVVYANITSAFMSNILWCATQIINYGKFVMPCPQTATWIHPKDVALACSTLLLRDDNADIGSAFEISGGAMLSFNDIATVLSDVLKVDIEHDDSNAMLDEMFGEDRGLFVGFFESERRYYDGLEPSTTFKELTGESPKSLTQWAEESKAELI
ncbi:NAD(P)H-binding protein [Dasania marina]|uniref:SDR family oxidoreductase n=1 Tax=Dasania marina TaxID=471499 RepID=UPI0030D7C872|tara:strand:- start:5643 stop:6524 length:882 start_codon:yes stop_codon:yes gene_type:complete